VGKRRGRAVIHSHPDTQTPRHPSYPGYPGHPGHYLSIHPLTLTIQVHSTIPYHTIPSIPSIPYHTIHTIHTIPLSTLHSPFSTLPLLITHSSGSLLPPSPFPSPLQSSPVCPAQLYLTDSTTHSTYNQSHVLAFSHSHSHLRAFIHSFTHSRTHSPSPQHSNPLYLSLGYLCTPSSQSHWSDRINAPLT